MVTDAYVAYMNFQ